MLHSQKKAIDNMLNASRRNSDNILNALSRTTDNMFHCSEVLLTQCSMKQQGG